MKRFYAALLLSLFVATSYAQTTDRLNGIQTGLAIKAPVQAVATSNITLSGLQTIGSVTVATNDRVLVTGQTDSTENGVYNAKTTSWVRAPDFDGNRDVTRGTLVTALRSTGQDVFYQVTTENPIVIGSSNITFVLAEDPNISYPIDALEVLAGLTDDDINSSYPVSDVRRYGAILDGSTDDSDAWADADSVADLGGPPIFVPADPDGMAIASGITASDGSNVVFEEGAFILYTGSAEETALTLGEVTGNTSNKVYRNIWVKRETLSDWTDEANIGVKFVNTIRSNIYNVSSQGFTIGIQVLGDNFGNGYNDYHLGLILNNKVGVDLLSDDTSSSGYVNENRFFGGRITAFTGANESLDNWGFRLRSEQALNEDPPNSNSFYGPAIELHEQYDPARESIAFLIEDGVFNTIYHARDETNSAPFMRVQGDSEHNTATTTNNLLSAVSNEGTYSTNFVYPIRKFHKQLNMPEWSSGRLPSIANEYDGAGAVYIPGLSWRNSSNANQHMSSVSPTAATVASDYVELNSSRGMGVLIDTRLLKRFVLRKDFQSGFPGRVGIIAYDASMTQLTSGDSGHPFVSGTSSAGFAYSTSVAGAGYQAGESTIDVFFALGDEVKFAWVGVWGGTTVGRITSFSIESVDDDLGSMSVQQGFMDSNSDPFPNDYLNYATAVPVTPTSGRDYPAGFEIKNFNVSLGEPSSWVVTTQGLGGTAVFSPSGQSGNRSGSGSPSGSVTPNFIGEEYLDTTGNAWYKAYGTANTNWQAL